MRCPRWFAVLAWVAFLAAGSQQAAADRTRVWIDTDAACTGAFATDVDDCWAIAFLLRSPNIEVAGISTVFGNRDRAPTRQEIADILHRAGPVKEQGAALPIVEGAEGPASDGRPAATPAVKALIRALEQEPLTILALGPVTNIAALAVARPDLAGKVSAVVAVAGQRPGDRFFPGDSRIFHVHDMNFAKDTSAFETLLTFRAPLVLVPYDAASQVTIDAADLAVLRNRDGGARWLSGISAPWLDFWANYFSASGFYPFDLVAAARIVLPGSLICGETHVRVVRRYGLFRTRDTLETDETKGRRVTYCDGVETTLKHRLVSVFR